MPFIKPEKRDLIDAGMLLPSHYVPGDLCYVHYKKMVAAWQRDQRWTTAHNIYKDSLLRDVYDSNNAAARDLAWQVFFHLHVMPYELEKRAENGDIS